MKQKLLIFLALLSFVSIRTLADTTCPNTEIWYTSTDGTKLNLTYTDETRAFGATIESNEYTDGKGIIKFNGNVTSIGESAFLTCPGLKTVTIPNSVTSVGSSAFMNCTSLESVQLSTALETIGNQAFENCSALTSVSIPEGVTSIGNSAFVNCTSLASVSLPTTLLQINERTFENCSSLESIDLKQVTSIGEGAFYKSGLTSISIPATVKTIGDEAFEEVPLTSVTLAEGLETIGAGAFWAVNITSLDIPKSVTYIDFDAFYKCSSLATVTMHSIPYLDDEVFDDCASGLTISLTLDDSDHPFITEDGEYLPEFTSVVYNRSLSAGKYGTIVLPFVPANANDFVFYEMTGTGDGYLTFKEVPTASVAAGKPYLYKNADDSSIKTQFTASNATLTVTSTDPDVIDGWQMKGALQKIGPVVNENYYVISNNIIQNTTGKVTVNPMRAYFENSGEKAKMQIHIEGESTAIDAIEADNDSGDAHAAIYNLSGQQVGADYKGIVIAGGKKFFQK